MRNPLRVELLVSRADYRTLPIIVELMEVMIKEERYGVQLEVPEGLHARQFQSGYIFGDEELKGLLLMLFHRNETLEELKTDIYAGFFGESGFNIQVDGQIQDISDSLVMAHYKGVAENKPAKGFSIGLLSPYGGGVLIATIVSEEEFSEAHMDRVEDLARSIEWFEPELKSGQEEWTAFLQHKNLSVRQPVADGMTHIQFDDQDAFTCVFASDDPEFSFDSFEAGGANLRGQWEVVMLMDEFYLKLTFFNGEEQQYRLRLIDDYLLLDEQPWNYTTT